MVKMFISHNEDNAEKGRNFNFEPFERESSRTINTKEGSRPENNYLFDP